MVSCFGPKEAKENVLRLGSSAGVGCDRTVLYSSFSHYCTAKVIADSAERL